MTPEEKAAAAAQVQLLVALEELKRWPEIPGVQVGVMVPNRKGGEPAWRTQEGAGWMPEGELQPWIVPPERFIGVFEALHKHASGIYLTASVALKALELIEGLRDNVEKLVVDLCEAAEEERNEPGSFEDSGPRFQAVLKKWGIEKVERPRSNTL